MSFRAKYRLHEVRQSAWAPAMRTLVFQCQYDTSIPEDQRFYDATPTGEITMLVNNPAVIDSVKLGEYFYVDFAKAD